MSDATNNAPMPNRETRSELASDHALGLTEGAALERAARLMATDAGFRADVEGMRLRLAELDATAPEHAPGARVWAAIEAELDKPARSDTVMTPRRSGLLDSLAFWRPAALGAGALACLLAIGFVVALLKPPAQPIYVAVLQTEEGRAQAVVNAYADGTVTLVPITPIGVPDGRIIEVWTLQSREQGPISIGRMDRARTMKLDLKLLRRPDAGHLFELTAEPPGGSPTGRPTGPVLSKGLAGQAL